MTAMIKFKTIGFLALIPMLGMWSCSSSNQLASGSKVIYDDLYGGGSEELRMVSGKQQGKSSTLYDDQEEYNNYIGEESIDNYYDESYLSSRDVKRSLSDKAGYNSGFEDGYFAGRNQMNYGSYWPGASMMNYNMGFHHGMRNAFFMGGPMMGWGYNRYSYWNSPFMYNSWGYDPWMSGMYGGWGSPFMGYGFGSSFYMSSMMYGMYGYNYNPWYYNRPVIIGDGSLAGSRTYGPRGVTRTTRTGVNDSFANNNRTGANTGTVRRSNANSNLNNARQSSRSGSGDSYYARPRSAGDAFSSGARSSNSARSSVGSSARAANSGNYYYAAPRSGSGYSTSGRTSGSTYSAPRSNSGYSAPSRSYNNSGNSYSTPSRSNNNSYSQPRSNNSYSTPRSSAPSYSAPARSSAPASAPSGGGASRSRGPR